MIMAGPDIPAGQVRTTPVSHVDCYQSIFHSIGAEMPEDDRSGQSLFAVADAPDDGERIVLSQYHAVGAVTVHGTIGIYGMLAFGIFGAGLPALQGDPGTVPTVSFMGQLVGSVVFILLGLVPGYIVSLILKMCGLLRVGEAAEVNGLDPTKVPVQAYPEGISASATPAE